MWCKLWILFLAVILAQLAYDFLLHIRLVDGRAFHQGVKTQINTIACSHMARRTFIGNIYKLVKDPNLVSALTGHVEGSRAFTRYRTIDIDMKKDLVMILEGKQ